MNYNEKTLALQTGEFHVQYKIYIVKKKKKIISELEYN